MALQKPLQSLNDDSVLYLHYKKVHSLQKTFVRPKLRQLFCADYCAAHISSLLCVFGEQQASSSSRSCTSPEVSLYFSIVLLQPLQTSPQGFSPFVFFTIWLSWWRQTVNSHSECEYIYPSCHIDRTGCSTVYNIFKLHHGCSDQHVSAPTRQVRQLGQRFKLQTMTLCQHGLLWKCNSRGSMQTVYRLWHIRSYGMLPTVVWLI